MPVKTGYGMQADAWGAVIFDHAQDCDTIEQSTIANIKARGWDNVTAQKGPLMLEGVLQDHVIVEQDLGNGGRATVAVRVAKQGNNDLEVGWRVFEKNVKAAWWSGMSQGMLIFWGGMFCLAGCVTIEIGLGIIPLIIGVPMLLTGLGWWKVDQQKPNTNVVEQVGSRKLAGMVDTALMKAISEAGVSTSEMRVLQRSSTEGMGRLARTDVLDELTGKPKLEL